MPTRSTRSSPRCTANRSLETPQPPPEPAQADHWEERACYCPFMRRADAGVLGGEPFFRVLHEQHPDVDLVILPPIDSPDPDQPLASADKVRQVATAARSAFDRVLAAAGHP